MAKLIIKIKPDGNTEIEGVSCSGEICKLKSRPLEEALGITTDFVEKPEYYNAVEQEELKQEIKE